MEQVFLKEKYMCSFFANFTKKEKLIGGAVVLMILLVMAFFGVDGAVLNQ